MSSSDNKAGNDDNVLYVDAGPASQPMETWQIGSPARSYVFAVANATRKTARYVRNGIQLLEVAGEGKALCDLLDDLVAEAKRLECDMHLFTLEEAWPKWAVSGKTKSKEFVRHVMEHFTEAQVGKLRQARTKVADCRLALDAALREEQRWTSELGKALLPFSCLLSEGLREASAAAG
jgi:hypothetical protein